jgi:hypothetical protein
VRGHRLVRVAPALADHGDEHEGGDAGVDVDGGATGEVERAPLEQPALRAEHPVGEGRVHEQGPQADEQHPGLELQPVGGRPRDQRRRDDGEHHLEGEEQDRRDREEVEAGQLVEHRALGVQLHDVGHEGEVEVADEATPVAEGEGEADDGPEHADQAHGEEVLHEHAEHVLAADHAAVEEGEARRHEQHEGRRHEHPGGVAGIQGDFHSRFLSMDGEVDDRLATGCSRPVS